MQVKFEVFGAGFTQFHSEKKNRDYQRLRLIGSLVDSYGNKEPCTADLAYGGTFDTEPKMGDSVVLSLSSLSTRNAMLEVEFLSCVHDARESKQK